MTTVRNRLTRVKLLEELSRLDKTQKLELRRMECSNKRFHIRCLRNDKTSAKDSKLESPNFQMYVTHYPGFCYHRDGKCRIPDSRKVKSPDSCPYEFVNRLVLTNGEADADKILCLHLLAVHSLPSQEDNRQSSAAARAADEFSVLPLCILQIKDDEKESKRRVDEGILFMNIELANILHTVFDTLRNLNPTKLEYVREMCKNPHAIKEILEKPNVRRFLDSLCGRFIISSCEVFQQVKKTENISVLEICDVPECLKLLVGEIKYNLLTQCTVCCEEEDRATSNQQRVKDIAQMKTSTLKCLLRPSLSQKNLLVGADAWKTFDKTYKLAVEPDKESTGIRKRVGDCYACTERIVPAVSTTKAANKVSKMGTSDAAIRQFLRKMSNEDRILIGRSAASLKNWKINHEGLENSWDRTPLSSIVIPVLGRESAISEKLQSKAADDNTSDDEFLVPDRSAGSKFNISVEALLKMKQEIAYKETKEKLKKFLVTKNP